MRTSIAYVRRWQTHVDRIRAWIRTSPEDAYAGRTRTPETRMCVVEICSRDMRTSSRTSGNYVRSAGKRTSVEYARQRITYISITSPSHVHRTRGKCVRHGKYVRRWKTYINESRTSVTYVRASQRRRICTHGCRSPNLYCESPWS